jgi:hypothetical protein
MESFARGWNFLKQAWQMALADRDLIKPSVYALFVGFGVTVAGSLPIIAAALLLGDGGIVGQVVLGVLGALLVFAQFAVAYVFSAMTVYLIYGYLSEGDGRMDKAWAIARRDFFDVLTLAAASTVVNLFKNAVRGKNRSGGRNFLANLIDTLWTEATYLVLPIMVIEDISLPDGLKRATQIVRNNLLLIGVSTVGVRAVTGLIGLALGTTGVLLGLAVGFGLVTLSGGATFGWVLGILFGILLAAAFIMSAAVISSYTATAYHTCLYLWAREVEQAQAAGKPLQVEAPAPLAAVLD